jgi:hypothetical protein
MRRLLIVTALVSVVAGVLGASGATSALAGRTSNDGSAPVQAIGGASSKYARAVALVAAGGSVIRSQGVAAVTHPSIGLYCIDPKDDYDVTRVVPNVTVDWSTSFGDALLAQYRSSGVGCPAGNIAVLTMSGEDGTFDPSNDVSFTVTVP